MTDRRGVKSFVLRSGRMSRAQSRSYAALGPRFLIPYTAVPGDFAACFGAGRAGRPLVVEIGFGMGRETAETAFRNPGNNYLGVEVFRAGIGKLLWEIERLGLENVRIVERDAAEVLETMMAPETAAAFHLFFPDPWPKKKHHKRRLVQPPFTGLLASRLAPGGYVYMATDWEDYACSALAALSAAPGLENPFGPGGPDGSAAGFAPRREWRPVTKFERKGLAGGRRIWELYLKKA